MTETPTGFPEPSGQDPDDRDPHHALNNPATDPDPTEWPDPYDKREDPRDPPDPDGAPFGSEPHPQTGSRSTSVPPPKADPAADPVAGPKRDEVVQ